MKIICLFLCLIIKANYIYGANSCGCKRTRSCYEEMLETLKEKDESACIEDAAIGSSTLIIFLKALEQFCGKFIVVRKQAKTFEGRFLYEVEIISENQKEKRNDTHGNHEKPVIILEAGQEAGSESSGLAMYFIEQFVACEDYAEMIHNVQWIILPSTNPDGQEYARFNRVQWKKNLRLMSDNSMGVDISRNFNTECSSYDTPRSGFSPVYPGPWANSENETKFIKGIVEKYRPKLKAYVSIRRDGHALLYPYGHSSKRAPTYNTLVNVSNAIAAKVNHRASGVQSFISSSIYEADGKPRCGHSVDYVYTLQVPFVFEMRVFLGFDNDIISEFQPLPRGYEASLRNGYFTGIRELYNVVLNEKKYTHKT